MNDRQPLDVAEYKKINKYNIFTNTQIMRVGRELNLKKEHFTKIQCNVKYIILTYTCVHRSTTLLPNLT